MTPLAIDHLVLTVADQDTTIAFYTGLLGFGHTRFGDGRHALTFGDCKLNLHPADGPFEPHARSPVPGAIDLCLRVAEPVEALAVALRARGVAIEEGPVRRTGARAPLLSIYLRDPDGNLIELANERPG